MRKIALTLVTLLNMCAPVVAQDNGCYDYEDSCNPCSDWTVSADYLYWTTRFTERDFAVDYDGTNFLGNVYSVDPGFHSGFRVGLSKACCDFAVDTRYTHFSSSDSRSISDATNGDFAGTQIVDDVTGVSQGSLEYISASWEVDLDLLEVTLAFDLEGGCNWDGRVFGGFKFASIDQKSGILYSTLLDQSTTLDRVAQFVDMKGYGLTLGVDGGYSLFNCLDLVGSFSYDMLLSQFDRRFHYRTSADGGATYTEAFDLSSDFWNLVSVVNLSMGVEKTFGTCFCSDVTFGLGYELHQWFNFADFFNQQAESGEYTMDRHTSALGFDGLYLRLSASF